MYSFLYFLILTWLSKGFNCSELFVSCGEESAEVQKIKLSNVNIGKDYINKYTSISLINGTDPTIEIKFTPKSDSESATITLSGEIAVVRCCNPLTIPQLIPRVACGHWGVKCPLKKGVENQLKFTLPVSRDPKLFGEINLGSVHIFVKLQDDYDKHIICQEIYISN